MSLKGVLCRLTLQNERCGVFSFVCLFVCFAGGVDLYPGSQIMQKYCLVSEKMHSVQQALFCQATRETGGDPSYRRKG